GIGFPAITVDHTNGPFRGRVYVTWNESLNWYNDLSNAGTAGTVNETEANNTKATANPFSIGQKIVGSFGSTSDVDFFRFSAARGTSYLFWADGTNPGDGVGNAYYSMRVLCTDVANANDFLTLAGDDDPPTGGFPSFSVWTCPEDGTYYLRLRYLTIPTGGSLAPYTIRTAVAGAGSEPGPDHPDRSAPP